MGKFSKLSHEALFLGRAERQGRRRWTRSSADALPGADEAVLCPGGKAPHIMTFAPHRSGRDRSCVVPNLLNYTGQAVVLDIDGRAYAATADARRALGQQVMRLDPFGLIAPAGHTYTPVDWIQAPSQEIFSEECRNVAELFSRGPSFGDLTESDTIGLLSAIIGYLYVVPEKKVNDLYDILLTDDVVYSLAVVLDTIGKKLSVSTYSEIASFLNKEDKARTRILARAAARFKVLSSLEVEAAMAGSDFMFPSDRPVTVYVIVPAERVTMYATLLRVWIGGLLANALRAPDPAVPSLFLLDHCAELLPFPQLEAAYATMSHRKVRIWSFWNDVSQLRAGYPRGWPAMIAGSGAVQVFGTGDPEAAAEAATVLGLPPDEIRSLGAQDQIVRLDGAPRRLRRLSMAGGAPPR
ncbi:type IV secretion system protein VirD4 [Catenulispora sp. MAP12-49]|uniref:type IV secretory system conjugative DNA transfer family protein n=1 Tax=Catenulispora sp. MAP12-49 TaxID=3156302 RepID=UPI003518006D